MPLLVLLYINLWTKIVVCKLGTDRVNDNDDEPSDVPGVGNALSSTIRPLKTFKFAYFSRWFDETTFS